MTIEGPFAAKIDGRDANLADCNSSHFVVTNVQQIGQAGNRWLDRLPSTFFDMILFDEGHHNAAKSWQRLIEHFPDAKLVSLTATPFRSDGRQVTGKLIYRYSLLRAMRRGYIKTLEAVHVAPSELAFTFRDSQETATLQEVLKLRDEVWFSRGVALAEQCNRSIVDASIRACEELRQSSQQRQQIFAAACSVEHAEMVAALYRKVGYHAEAIHSLQAKAQQRNTLQRLRNGRLDVIVQVQMLGEGFDHPPLSVAAVFRPFRTLSPYVQFIGRVMRVMTQNSPLSPENRGIVVTHVGLNTDRHWDQFRQLDDDDQALLSGMLNGMTSTEIAAAEKANGAKSDRSAAELALMPRHFAPEMLVEWERITDVETSNFAEIDLVNNEGPVLPEEVPTNKPAYKVGLIAGPQQRRREARSRLKTSVDDAIRQVLVQARLPGMGRHIGRMFPMFRHQDNWSALRFRLYIELNRTVGRRPGSGNEWSLTEVEQALESLPKISDRIVKELVQRQQQSQQKCRRFAGY